VSLPPRVPESSKPLSAGQKSPTPVPAATILLVRDGEAGVEVFMVVRHHEIDFASGALVFPGGKLDKGDFAPDLRGLATGGDGLDDQAFALRVGAIREAFEECGVLFAREAGTGKMVDAARFAALAPYRDRLVKGELDMLAFLKAEQLVLAMEDMVHFAHWITPDGMPKRFDTHFFLAPVPPGHDAVHDGWESVDSVWIAPEIAVAEAEAGTRTMVFPTRLNLKKLAASRSIAEAMASARTARVVTVLPKVQRYPDRRVLQIPAEAGYGGSEFTVAV
jgi:8-oxo-dGTP pyrophosphatase MutT (NUDIX family)